MSQCEPEQDEIDKRILFEMTGIRLDQDDFRAESSEEDVILLSDGQNQVADEQSYSMIN